LVGRVSAGFGHRLKIAADPGTWTALASNARWRRDGPCPTPSAQLGSGPPAVVRWPLQYEHPLGGIFTRPIREGFDAVASVVAADIPQAYKGIVMIEIDHGDGPRRVAIDYYDFTFVNHQCAGEVDTYFKLQYQPGGYPEFANVQPGGYVTDKPFLYAHWCRLRALRHQARPTSDVFGRFGLSFAGPVRGSAIEMMQSERRIVYSGGTRRTQHSRYLREMARARVCIDLPGQGPFCCRLIEGLAMGCCIVAARHAGEMPVMLRDGVEIVYCEEDLSDLADLCVAYAQDESKRAPIEAAAARYFDENLHPVRMAERYLRIVGECATRRTALSG
jgi:Glycosyl transferases group 1